jgi:hypothetical protein
MFSLQIGREESIVHEWLDVCVTKAGHLVALQKLGQCPKTDILDFILQP